MLAQFPNLFIKVFASDSAGNSSHSDVVLPIADPQLQVASLTTVPAQIEERSQAELYFGLSGDISLVERADIRVFNQWQEATLDRDGNGQVTGARASIAQPLLSSIAQPQVAVSLRVELTNGTTVSAEDSYLLNLDATAPQIAIVAPLDGAAVPSQQELVAILRTFDARGVERIEARLNDGEVQILQSLNEFRFTPPDTSPLTLSVRAIDLAGNASEWQSATYTPYDAGDGVPLLQLLAPRDNQTFRENETISVHVRLENVPSADLYLDDAGIESSEIVASLGDGGNGVYSTEITLPTIDSDRFFALRLEFGQFKDCLLYTSPSPRD